MTSEIKVTLEVETEVETLKINIYLIQCFTYIYYRQQYVFIIVNIIYIESGKDSVLNLLLH